MKEFKASQKNEVVENDNDNDILFANDDLIDKKINEDLKEIKEKLNAEKLSDEFKANLNAKLQEELNKTEDLNKGKIIKFPSITRKFVGICASFVLIFLSCFVHADDIENVILELFGNTDKIIANAIEEGNYKEIDMDYVEDQGISIKVDYVVVEDDELYIAFNVLGEEKFDKVLIGNMVIYKDESNVLYTDADDKHNTFFSIKESRISKENLMIIYKLYNVKEELKNIKRLKIKIDKVYMINNNQINNKVGKWDFEINI